MTTTLHFEERATSRGLRRDIFDFIVYYGVEMERSGTRFLTIVERALPPGIDDDMVRRSTGWIVVISDSGALLTCYRRERAVRHVCRKLRESRRRCRHAA